MGGSGKFSRALTRKAVPAFPRFQGGNHKGIEPPNVPWEIFVACSTREGIDSDTYERLHTTIDYDGLMDLLEMKQASDSWAHAGRANAREDA